MPSPLTPSQQRLRDMEILLRWEGELDNARLRAVFGVQTVQASRLLATFLAEHGQSVQRTSPHAPVTPTKGFRPKLAGASPDEYLRLVEAAGPLKMAPFVEDLRMDLAPVPADIFAAVAQACLKRTGLRVKYRSLANPKGGERLMFPHALVRAARRWHVRAWCPQRQGFRDFALGRISSATLESTNETVDPRSDTAWVSIAKLVVVAHPGLSPEQATLLRDEYLGGETSRVIKVRRSLVSYTVQDLRLAVDEAKQTPPEFQLALKNAAEFAGDFAVRGSAPRMSEEVDMRAAVK
jgi:hypothetical protein